MQMQQLVEAIAALDATDALQCKLTLDEWKLLAPFLSVRFLRPGDPLMNVGECEPELFILAQGELHVVIQGSVVASLLPGSVVGEGTFFSGQPRSATVVPAGTGIAWGLHRDRFDLMAKKHPQLAVDLVTALATVLAIRMREAILVGHFA